MFCDAAILVNKGQFILFACWLVSAIATGGSLFFSEVMGYPPCVLCWYQRICMYPLVLILGAAFLGDGRTYFRYSFPLVLVGLAIAIYHNLLYYNFIPESAAPCRQGISCTTVFFEWLGFLTIPSLSLISFIILFMLLILSRKAANEK